MSYRWHPRGSRAEQRLKELADALDPSKAPSRVRTLAEMTPEERAEMQRLYGARPNERSKATR